MTPWWGLQKTIEEVNAMTRLLRKFLQNVIGDMFFNLCLLALDLCQKNLVVLLALVDALPEIRVFNVAFLQLLGFERHYGYYEGKQNLYHHNSVFTFFRG